MTPHYPNYGSTIIVKFWRNRGQSVYQVLEQQPSQKMQSYPPKFRQVSSKQKTGIKGKPPTSIIIFVILVAVIFMIAIFIRVIFFPEDFIDKGPTPRISMNWNEDHEQEGNYTGYVVSISGVAYINIDDVTVTVSHGSYTGSRDLDDLAMGYILTVGAFTLFFNDLRPTGRLGAEDMFVIIRGNPGDTIRLVYKPTDGQMCSSTLH